MFIGNVLIIGEYFTAVDLSEIARNLDQAEQAALREGTTEQHEDNRNANASTSQNMDDSGISSKFILKLVNFLYFIKLFVLYRFLFCPST